MRLAVVAPVGALALLVFVATAVFASGDNPQEVATSRAHTPKPTPVQREMLEGPPPPPVHHEKPHDPPAPKSEILRARATSPAKVWVRGRYESIQVNVDAQGNNIVGDAANEPSIAVDPTNPARMAIGWRQFDTIESDFRQAGWAYSHNAGQTWTFPGVLEPGQFRSDPVLGADADGNFYFYSLSAVDSAELFKSTDGGETWTGPINGFGGDKEWMTIDQTNRIGRGNIYGIWNVQFSCCPPYDFTRSTNAGLSFMFPIALPQPSMKWGTLSVGPDGELYACGATLGQDSHLVAKSTNAQDPWQTPLFDFVRDVNLGGVTTFGGVNPAGLLGQVWVDTDRSDGPSRGNVYLLSSVDPPGNDPLDVMFARSIDGGLTFSEPVRVNDDPLGTGAWQWFGTMAVAPNGRIDAIWNDTRADALGFFSELYYSYSLDAGLTWSENVPLSPRFNHFLGYPSQDKLGDYYDMESDNFGTSIAFAATFNDEQDVYYLRIGDIDCNGNGISDVDDIANETSKDCNHNDIPDECEADCNDTGVPDDCDVIDGTSEDCNGNLIPDECEPNFDGDEWIDACDWDIDNDGVHNEIDVCDFTPPGVPVDTRGRPISDTNNSCLVDLGDVGRLIDCVDRGGPGVSLSRTCTIPYGYDPDDDVDLYDVAGFQNAFGPR
ncbi:MAG: hypothetical protein WBE26_04010 [Phycisphaerae bacterium]